MLLREGTDTSQGKGQLISNINACMAVVDSVRTTLVRPRSASPIGLIYFEKKNPEPPRIFVIGNLSRSPLTAIPPFLPRATNPGPPRTG